TRAAGVKETLFLQLVPGEGVASILARTEARVRGKASEVKGDPYGRLLDVLASHKLCLIIDQIQHCRREDLPGLVRALKATKGPFRVLATSRGDPELSAMDVMLLHLERVGPLLPDEVRKLCKDAKLNAENAELVVADATRGGATAQPLTLKFML